MKKALITGTSSGIGHSLALALLNKNYEVFGISRTASDIKHQNFREILLDLCDMENTVSTIETKFSDTDFDILINNAGVGYYGLHMNLSSKMIHEMVTINLEIPMILSSLLLPGLIRTKGCIVNISSYTAKQNTNTHGVAYGATKAGLSSFGTNLFSEIRKHNVRVINIQPEMTITGLYRNADFEASTEEGCALTPEMVTDAVCYAIDAPASACIREITLTPQLNRIKRK